jgi:hypothetical protein
MSWKRNTKQRPYLAHTPHRLAETHQARFQWGASQDEAASIPAKQYTREVINTTGQQILLSHSFHQMRQKEFNRWAGMWYPDVITKVETDLQVLLM